jgi:hypothetical protein
MSEDKKPKIVFEPGCFDNFDGTQEELEEFVTMIKDMFENKTEEEIKAMSQPLDMEALLEEDPEMAEALMQQLVNSDSGRKLQ